MRDLGLDPYTRALLVDKHNPYSLVNKLRYQVRGKKMNRNIRERLEGDNLYCVSEKFVDPLEELIAEMVISMAF